MSYILVAEDDDYIQMLIQRKLEHAGFSVRLMKRGDDALKTALQEPPRILLLDVQLPGLTGLEICQQFKQELGEKASPVIIVSARGFESDVAAAEAVGADDYLIKPFSPAELLARVEYFLNR